jgi:flagellin-like protein
MCRILVFLFLEFILEIHNLFSNLFFIDNYQKSQLCHKLLRPLKNNKALSPVIAAIILIAVVVAVSIAVAAWMGSISFSFMKVDELTVSSHTWSVSGNYVDLILKNSGTSKITINDVEVNGVSATDVAFISGNSTLGAGDTSIVRVTQSFNPATKYEFTITTASNTKCVYISSSSSTSSQIDWVGDGSDGSLTVSSGDQIVNVYAFLTGNENAEETTITVSSASGFAEDDEILLIQMQNSSGGEAGTYEFKHISSIMGNDITLTSSLDNSYYSGSFDSVDATASQIVRVPQYTSVSIDSGSSITAPAWDGYAGGIVVFRAETVTISAGGSIDVSEKGYRGGAYGPSNNLDGYQGESYIGKGIGGGGYGVGKMNNAGAGGSYICGGGGEYGGGATDSDPWTGSGDTYARKGEVYGVADLTKIFLGSGGGGQWNGNDPDPSDGGDGGGIIIIYANLIVAPTDGFLALGETTNGIQYGSYSYGSSGGAGGSIFLYARTIQGGTNFCRAIGGSGNHFPDRAGGDGGVGRIRLDYDTLTGTTTPSPGYTGSVS